MTPTEVLKMLKSKIYAAGLNNCNYAIETSDIEAINQALLLYDVSNRREQLIAFAQWLAHEKEYGKDGAIGTVDAYLESN